MWDVIYRPEGWIALALMYIVVTAIAVRRVPLSGISKWLFGLTVGPLFFALVWASSTVARFLIPEEDAQ
jgi:hypothetical protein